MNKQQTVVALLERAIEIEQGCRNLYLSFSQKFGNNSGIATFFLDMAGDEKEHKRILEDIYSAFNAEELNAPVDSNVSKKAIRIQKELKGVTETDVSNLNEAYEFAHELENGEYEAIFRDLVMRYASVEKKKEFADNMLGLHLQRLMDFGKKHPDSDWRKKISAQSG